jgi:ABC-type multidrug transport system fused ATPase/permease subunit
VFHFLAQKVSLHIGIGRARAGSQQTVIHNEFLSGIHQIITLRATRRWLDQFNRENRIHSDLYQKELMWLSIPRQFIEFSTVAMMVGLILVFRELNPDSFGEFLPKLGVIGIGLLQLLPAIASIGRLRMELMTGLPDMELVHQVLTDPVPRRESGHHELSEFRDSVAFKQATFAHKGRDVLLDKVDISFEKGQVTAIVGPSGSGKTTMVNLILGLFDPSDGAVSVDGVPIRELTEESWLSKIGYVSQEAFIYHATVADNIIFGRDGYTREDAIAASKIANAHEFISDLPAGYDTVVGERGMKISGGQQQRIAIARAVLTSPDILIFDEATSSLDSISERVVQEAIEKVSKDRTAIIIAHRLSTIRKADKIIVLDQGQVVEQGSHEELLKQHGDYSRLVESTQ